MTDMTSEQYRELADLCELPEPCDTAKLIYTTSELENR